MRNAAIRITVLTAFAWLVDRAASQTKRLTSDVLLLAGMLPVCGRCRKIRHGDDWQPLDTYVLQHPGEFKQELCPECARISAEILDRR